ncbi:putative B3 domain-containing protein at5g58280 [Phtheirospermum japonicum]|uniref:Putative B3 domain-containing protein at5g58280 n=1 Tax=Phtheirospermum japonicum TaxID=374723 RepID=A0A830CAD4_9LAMI|nr:putative B3 domain-containing protein at5g58280 [Phtheirospermum japonicum]
MADNSSCPHICGQQIARALLIFLASMENESNGNSYEDARKQRLLENKKRFEDLGLSKLSKSLSVVKKSEKSQVDLDQLPSLRKRSKLNSSWASYLARPIEEVKSATHEERARAYKYAEKLQSNLEAGNPSFVKSMVRSHVYSCFWLGLPNKFCEDHLPGSTVDMGLEDEEGSEYSAVFISKRTGLSGGWRAFALDHKLDDGDALVFELIEPTKFKIYGICLMVRLSERGVPLTLLPFPFVSKLRLGLYPVNTKMLQVYIVRASACLEQNNNVPVSEAGSDAEETPKDMKKKKRKKKSDDNDEIKNSTKSDKERPPQVSAPRRSLRNKK